MEKLKAKIKYERNFWKRKISKKNGGTKIFCISMQKNGTTSVGDFFEKAGFPTARWRHANNRGADQSWTQLWYEGNYEAIFTSRFFKSFQAYEDDPWWLPEFYKVVAHRFPSAQFVLFSRDPEKWFTSMMKHNKGMSIGDPLIHAKAYRREAEFRERYGFDKAYNPQDKSYGNLLSLEGKKQHYLEIYQTYNEEVKHFFKGAPAKRFIHLELEDAEKWQKLAQFLGVKIDQQLEVHANKTKQ